MQPRVALSLLCSRGCFELILLLGLQTCTVYHPRAQCVHVGRHLGNERKDSMDLPWVGFNWGM